MKYIKRKIDSELLKWKNEPTRKPLLLRGARQVGKSWSVRNLGKGFKYFIEVNLEKRRDLIPLFTQLTDVKEITNRLGSLMNTPVVEGETLLFIDEIQEAPDAIRMLRYFKEDYPELHVVAAGSMLEFALAELPSFGVGRIRSLFMYPFSFYEFLGAINKEMWIDEIEKASCDCPLFEALHHELEQIYRTFLMVGGMPACVSKWIETGDYNQCAAEQDEICQSYFDDFAKYAKKIEPEILRDTLTSVVNQNGKKFIYSKISSGVKQSDAKEALKLLCRAGLIKDIKMTAASGLPLGAQVNPKFSKYMLLDTGLFLRILNLELGYIGDLTQNVLAGSAADLVNKGALAEMYVGWELVKAADPMILQSLFYWKNTNKGATAEVDFISTFDMQVLPIEVKSGNSGKMKSLRLFMKNRKLKTAIRSSLENFSKLKLPEDEATINIIPLYAICNYRSYLTIPWHNK